MKQAAFFDIDGTVIDKTGFIPESTVRAIAALKERGIPSFIASGRGRGIMNDPRLVSLGFDGIVAGGGTEVLYRDRTIFLSELTDSEVERTLGVLSEFGILPILEGSRHGYVYLSEDYSGDWFAERVFREERPFLEEIRGKEGEWHVSKLTGYVPAGAAEHIEEAAEALSDLFYLIRHTPTLIEFMPHGISKGTGLERACEALGVDIRNSYAFGDSANDLGMFRSAGTAVAMGNATPEMKAEADYVTDALRDDGLANALKHFGLI